jgi:hypothetical protein
MESSVRNPAASPDAGASNEALDEGRRALVATLLASALYAVGPRPAWATSPARPDEGLPAHERPVEEVPYVQTPDRVVRRMLQLADVGERDIVWDLGSGDGRIVIAAARDFRARGVGYEIDRQLVELARRNARRAGVADRAVFIERDLFTLGFSAPSVVTMYLLPEFNLKLRPLLLAQMKPGSRVVSHEWDMGEWSPDETLTVHNEEKPHGTSREHRVFLWHIPAQVAGRWQVTVERRGNPVQLVLAIDQDFQRLTVRADRGEVRWAKLTGRRLELAWRETREGGERFTLRGEVAERRGALVWSGDAFSDGASINASTTRVGRFRATRG